MPDQRERTCCFTGHREIPPGYASYLRTATQSAIEGLIHKGVRYFGAGGALGFDTLAAQAVLDVKEKHPQIKLILVFPCKTQTRGWAQEDIEVYEAVRSRADKIVYTSEEYYRGCMHKRNRHLVEHSGYCICFLVDKSEGGTAYTVQYAMDKGRSIINLADMIEKADN